MLTFLYRIAGVRALLLLVGGGAHAALLLAPAVAWPHIIDEVAQNIVIDLKTTDGRKFDVVYALHDSHIAAFYDQARQLGLPTDRSDAAFAGQLASSFDYDGCTISPAKKRAWAPRPGFRAFPLTLTCPRPMKSLRLRRVDYRRDKTRTTLYIGLRIGDSRPRRMLIAPRLGALEIPVLTAGRPLPIAATSSADNDPHDAHNEGDEPGTERAKSSDFPDPERARATRRWASLKPPPFPILQAWAKEGAMHLAVGVDHLLFLAALVLCAATIRGLLVLVILFSIGHMAAMFGALILGLPGHWLIEVGIGLSIVWAGFQARDPATGSTLRSAVGALGFGLVHGWAFGSELARLAVGVDGLLWPLASFGIGLDAAQSVFCGAVYFAWRAINGRLSESKAGRLSKSGWARRVASTLIMAGGVAFAIAAAV